MQQGREGLIELLRRRYDFASWSGKAQMTGTLIREANLVPTGIPGWERVRSRRNDTVTPPRGESFWRPAGGNQDETLVRVDVFQLTSVEAAREYLLEALGEFQADTFGRRTDLGPGEVAFGFDTALLFARANLVVLVRNAGRQVIAVTPVAQAVDAAIARRLRGDAEESE